jgi:hypothetical protein
MPCPARVLSPAVLALELLTNDYINGEVVRIDGGIRFQPK